MTFFNTTFRTFIALICLSATVLHAQVKIGSTRAQVIEQYGEPTGATKLGNKEIMTYNGANIKLRDGVVYSIDNNFKEKQAEGKANAEQAKQQEAQAPQKNQQGVKDHGDYIDVRNGGKTINIKQLLTPGKVTVMDFYADWCGPCRQISPYLMKMAKNDSAVNLVKVDIVNWDTPVAKQFELRAIPNIRVYDKNGNPVGRPTSDYNEVVMNVERAKRR